MEHPRIIITIDGKTYSLRAGNPEAIGNIPADDRRHLINLLEAVKSQNSLSLEVAPQTLDQPKITPPSPPVTRDTATRTAAKDTKSERLGSGDLDALMDRLVMEEKRSRKPGLTRVGIYKVMGGFLLLIVVLVVIL